MMIKSKRTHMMANGDLELVQERFCKLLLHLRVSLSSEDDVR